MLKVVFVYESRQSELLPRFLELFFNSQKSTLESGSEVLELIKIEKPKLVFFDFAKSINKGGDLTESLLNFGIGVQFHVYLIKISPANFILYQVLFQKISEFFKDHFGHHHKGKGIQEAFGKR